MRGLVSAFVGGGVFASGLVVSGMTQPSKVIGFLDVSGNWDPSLALVMMAALGTNFVLSLLLKRMQGPVFRPKFLLPKSTSLDGRLLFGSALFGVGWGLAGYCPGPGIASLGAGRAETLYFLVAMFAGMLAHRAYVALQDGGKRATVGSCDDRQQIASSQSA